MSRHSDDAICLLRVTITTTQARKINGFRFTLISAIQCNKVSIYQVEFLTSCTSLFKATMRMNEHPAHLMCRSEIKHWLSKDRSAHHIVYKLAIKP